MAKKYEDVVALYSQTIERLRSSPEAWPKFLETAGRLYGLNFDAQVLVYAQRPDASAVMSMEQWNKRFGRWVNRGTESIRVFRDAESKQLDYLFDLEDTNETLFAKPVPIWELRQEQKYLDTAVDALKRVYGDFSSESTIEATVINAVGKAFEDGAE